VDLGHHAGHGGALALSSSCVIWNPRYLLAILLGQSVTWHAEYECEDEPGFVIEDQHFEFR
jgi:hypothetical protein